MFYIFQYQYKSTGILFVSIPNITTIGITIFKPDYDYRSILGYYYQQIIVKWQKFYMIIFNHVSKYNCRLYKWNGHIKICTFKKIWYYQIALKMIVSFFHSLFFPSRIYVQGIKNFHICGNKNKTVCLQFLFFILLLRIWFS